MNPPSRQLQSIFTIVLASALVFPFTGCGAGITAIPTTPIVTPPVTPPPVTTPPVTTPPVTTPPVTTPPVTTPPVTDPPVTTPPVTTPPVTIPAAAFTGTVLAGAQPIAAASVQLYAAGTTGDGSVPTALLSTTLLTDATGAFTVPVGYVCPTDGSQLYLIARGGKLPTASANASIALVTALGLCNQITTASKFVVNEVTTVAAAWALSQFLTATGNIGASSTNSVGLANAFAAALSLANPATGSAPGATFPANGTSPAPRINTLANLLHSCIVSDAAATACSALSFFSTTAPDTLAAIFQIIRHPAANVTALYAQSLTSAVFTPMLTVAPSDWTLFLNFTGAGMQSPAGIAVDASGSVWVSSYFSAASKFTPLGAPIFPSGITGFGLKDSYGIAIDALNNVWIPNETSPFSVNTGFGSVTVLNASGQPLSGANGYSAGGLNYPIAIAIDPNTTAWVLDYGNSHLTHLNSSGVPLSGATGYIGPKFAFPVALAIDASHNVWVANLGSINVTKVSPDGQTFTDYNCCDSPDGIAIDQTGNIWVANYYANSVSQISPSGVIISNGYTGSGSINRPQGMAIDGAGNVWVANFRAGNLTQLAGASSTTLATGQPLSPAAGWAPDANLRGAFSLAIDASGNVWVANFNDNSITEFVGAASPVNTPQSGPPQTP